MNINVLDGSNYFRGLLLLIRKDRAVAEPEIELMKRVGAALGFESEFCSNAIREVLDNVHIDETPPDFSTEDLAQKFIKDGLRIASSDGELHPLEEAWLKATAEKNNLDPQWFRDEVNRLPAVASQPQVLDADDLSVIHSLRGTTRKKS